MSPEKPLRYRYFYRCFWALLCLLVPAGAQSLILEGLVINDQTGQPVAGASVYLENTTLGSSTDSSGHFMLRIGAATADSAVLIIQHIAYDTLKLILNEALTRYRFRLTPLVRPLEKIVVEVPRDRTLLANDLPAAVTIVEASEFEGRGYIDLGDLLRTEKSIQIEEDLSGRKSLSLRAGNPEDVVVFYNGLKMNSLYDNVFDLSLLNVEDMRQVEIIKGSNTALYGAEAFSGVINIVPRVKQDYTARFIQKIGSYRSGDWNLQLNYSPLQNLSLNFTVKDAAYKRILGNRTGFLENRSRYLSGNILYEIHPSENGNRGESINLMYMRVDSDHENNSFVESIGDENEIVALNYKRWSPLWQNMEISAARQTLNNNQALIDLSGTLDRRFANRRLSLNVQNRYRFSVVELISAYQFEDNRLNFSELRRGLDENPQGLEAADIYQQRHGAVVLARVNTALGEGPVSRARVDFSYRYDWIRNSERDVLERRGERSIFYEGEQQVNRWQAGTVKFSTNIGGRAKNLEYDFFMNGGSNIKFPTIFNQISQPSPYNPGVPEIVARLLPEKNRSLEVGLSLAQLFDAAAVVNEWKLEFSQFTNTYENKFRNYYIPGVPLAFYENVPNADIRGLEALWKLVFIRRIMTMEWGARYYDVSDRAAFPFKNAVSVTAALNAHYAGYRLQFKGFFESKRLGWLRDVRGDFVELRLPSYYNFDAHLSKWYTLGPIRLFASFSARNILNTRTVLEGIAIRDRRLYLGLGVEY